MATLCSGPCQRTTPRYCDELTIVGSIDIGMPRASHSAWSHSRVSRFINMVRDALVTSVTCRALPFLRVRFHVSHVSTVPKINSPRSARSRAPSTLSRIHAIFGPEKYVDTGNPVTRRTRSSPTSSRSLAQMSSVRVSCHTIALYTGSPVSRSHTIVVSR